MRRSDRVGGTATILVTDLVGSTAMFDRLGDERAERLLRAHLGEMRDLVRSFGGKEVKSTGDGIMAAFPAAWLASECAVAMQRTLHLAREEGADEPLHVRIGLHSGDTTADRHDYYGIAVAVAARLCDRAAPDAILMSGVTRGLVGSRGGHSFADAGVSELKGIDEPVGAWTVSWGPGQLPPAPPPGLEPKRGPLVGAAALVVVAAGAAFALSGGEAGPRPRPTPIPAGGETVRVSLKYTGVETAGASFQPDIAGDGSALVFASNADNIVDAADRYDVTDVFHLALPTDPGEREVTMLSARGGRQGNGPSMLPSVSDDGLTVAFLSDATNLDFKPDRKRATDVFVHDVDEPKTARVSVATGGEPANGASFDNHVSGDGNLVAFTTAAYNLAFENRDQNERNDIFVHDRQGPRSKTNRVNIRSGTLDEADGDSSEPVLSEDGRYVAFTSEAPDLVPGDTNNRFDVFRYDREQRKTVRVSLTSEREPTNRPSSEPSISDDGNLVAFASSAGNLVDSDRRIARSIFVRDMRKGTTTLVSRAFGSDAPGNGASSAPEISGDGRYVVFQSDATDLVPDDTNGVADIFVFDLVDEETIRVSTGIGGEADGDSSEPAITDDGAFVVFTSGASNLVEGDINNVTDVFLRGPLT